jgi:hypothetical protein
MISRLNDPVRFPVMKKIFTLLVLTTAVLFADAQTKKTNVSPAPAAKSPVSSTATLTSFETSLVQGKLTLRKTFNKSSDGALFTTNYSVVNSTSRASDNSKVVSISLNRESFEMVFTRGTTDMTDKLPTLNKFISDKNISLTEEKGWVAVLDYYNNLP